MSNEHTPLADSVGVSVGRGAFSNEFPKVHGHLSVRLYNENGELKETREVDNLVVDAGKGQMAQRMVDSSVAAPTHMALGTGSTAAAAGDTALGAEIDRNALTSNTRSSNVQTLVGNWAAGDATNSAITEAGLFNASSTGTMTARAVFTLINKGASDTLQITWTITYG